jgi:hypothetical protein
VSQTAWERRPPDHTVTQNDTGVLIEDILKDSKGVTVDLTGASSVQYQARLPGQLLSAGIDQAATIVSPATAGRVRRTLAAADTDTPGDLIEQWKVTFGGGAIERFPATKHKLRIVPDSAV